VDSKLSLEVVGETDIGLARDHNEDDYAIDMKKGLFIVADGLGGHEGGEVASKLAVKTILNFFEDFSGDELESETIEDKINQSIQNAHNAIVELSEQNPGLQGMGTTIVLTYWQSPNLLYVANIGDSRAYLLCNQKLELLTQDHSIVAQLVQQGKITPEEARVHRSRNIVTQSIGIELGMGCYQRHLVLKEGDTIILCSDGLWDMLPDRIIEEIALKENTAQELCYSLIEAAKKAGGKDNITVIVILVKKDKKDLGIAAAIRKQIERV